MLSRKLTILSLSRRNLTKIMPTITSRIRRMQKYSNVNQYITQLFCRILLHSYIANIGNDLNAISMISPDSNIILKLGSSTTVSRENLQFASIAIYVRSGY